MTEITTDPFVEAATDPDAPLVAEALAGDRASLTTLIERHQPWIYNLAFRMVLLPEDAEDVTQEVLVKLITKLSSFNPAKAKFRTWLYRVVVNHVLNMKPRGAEPGVKDFETYYGGILAVPDQNPDASPETAAVIKDLEVGCVQGVLLCLERRARLAFLLATAYRVTAEQGAEILETTAANFRQILSRARKSLHQYMSGNCGLVNEDAPCRCRKKVTGFMQAGWKTADRLVYSAPGRPRLHEVLHDRLVDYSGEMHEEFTQLFGSHPFYQAPEVTAWLKEVLDRPDFREAFRTDPR